MKKKSDRAYIVCILCAWLLIEYLYQLCIDIKRNSMKTMIHDNGL